MKKSSCSVKSHKANRKKVRTRNDEQAWWNTDENKTRFVKNKQDISLFSLTQLKGHDVLVRKQVRRYKGAMSDDKRTEIDVNQIGGQQTGQTV